MNNEIKEDLYKEKRKEFVNTFVMNIIKNNKELINEYSILEVEYNITGEKKDIYQLASERDIKIVQIKSDENELDYLFSQNKINEEEYIKGQNELKQKNKNINELYDEEIFEIINTMDIEEIKKSIVKYNLNNIDLERLRFAISSTVEKKLEEFRNNNKLFIKNKLSYWNYKYDKISKQLSKSREIEAFLINLQEKS